MKAQWTDFITLLKREVVPALGCTEPMSVALAAANCRKLLGQDPTRISVWVSGNLFKNGMGVGVPGTGMIGLPVAAAVGITGGNPDAGLEVLKTLTPEQVDAAKALLPIIKVDVKDVPDVLYAEVLARCRNAPSTPFFITAAIPLIPGSTLYYCMNAVVSNDLPAAEHFGEQTFLAALGIAGGMAIAWCLADLSRKLRGRL